MQSHNDGEGKGLINCTDRNLILQTTTLSQDLIGRLAQQ
jgi:hypothetical protein